MKHFKAVPPFKKNKKVEVISALYPNLLKKRQL